MKNKIPIASDHAGFDLKESLKEYLNKRFEVVDYGPTTDESMDYPDTGIALAQAVADGKFDRGILMCGSGIGISITANKVRGVRAALCHNSQIAKLSRNHNDSNIVVLPARFVSLKQAKEIVDSWLTAEFEGGRHRARLDKITKYENEGLL